jgi:hypothetical protein
MVTYVKRQQTLGKIMKFFLICAAIALFSTKLFAYCMEPNASNLPSVPYNKPSPPYCLIDYKFTGKHSCSKFDLDIYIQKINSYIESLQLYTQEVKDYAIKLVTKADDYAICEAKEIKKTLE